MMFEIGQQVVVDGDIGHITGVAEMTFVNGPLSSDSSEVYLVDFGEPENPVHQRLVWGQDIEAKPKRRVSVAYVFTAEVEAADEVQAKERLREVLVDTLTWDGDDEAPPELEELSMRNIDVPEGLS